MVEGTNLSPTPSTSSPDQDKANASQAPAKRARKRQFTEQERLDHSIIERQRREALNQSLVNLARLIPKLTDTPEPRLTKALIINEALNHLTETRKVEEQTSKDVRRLLQERDELLAEVNSHRRKTEECERPTGVTPDSLSRLLSRSSITEEREEDGHKPLGLPAPQSISSPPGPKTPTTDSLTEILGWLNNYSGSSNHPSPSTIIPFSADPEVPPPDSALFHDFGRGLSSRPSPPAPLASPQQLPRPNLLPPTIPFLPGSSQSPAYPVIQNPGLNTIFAHSQLDPAVINALTTLVDYASQQLGVPAVVPPSQPPSAFSAPQHLPHSRGFSDLDWNIPSAAQSLAPVRPGELTSFDQNPPLHSSGLPSWDQGQASVESINTTAPWIWG